MTSSTSGIPPKKRPYPDDFQAAFLRNAPSKTQDLQEILSKLAEVTARAKTAAENLNKANEEMQKEVTVTPRSAFSRIAIPTPILPVPTQSFPPQLNGRVEQLESQFTQIAQNQNTTNSLLENLLTQNNQPKLKLTIPVQGLAPQAPTSSTAYSQTLLGYYEKGKELFEKKRFLEATMVLKELPKEHLHFEKASYLIAICYYELGNECWLNSNQLEAVKWHKKIPGHLLCYEEAQYKIGKYHYSQHDFHGALFPMSRVTRNHPEYLEAQLIYGICLSQLGRYNEAIPHFFDIQEINIDNPIAWYYLGYCFYKQGNYAVAEGNLLCVSPSHSMYIDAQNLIDTINQEQQRTQKPLYWRNQF